MIWKMILKSFDFQCDFDFKITTSKMILILNHLYLGDLIWILKSSTMMILPISACCFSLNPQLFNLLCDFSYW